ncbi:hypothetical protein HJG60_011822 [Phyllostomus discolor]|uniref:Uncharacterized protein n=1 Tax=Phyllostomus discolor TaxID=89673 RepID=A0A834DSR0_9CHIR|nr:hypothetical protein HJG60_011822 [Phyllostomus discolor]
MPKMRPALQLKRSPSLELQPWLSGYLPTGQLHFRWRSPRLHLNGSSLLQTHSVLATPHPREKPGHYLRVSFLPQSPHRKGDLVRLTSFFSITNTFVDVFLTRQLQMLPATSGPGCLHSVSKL